MEKDSCELEDRIALEALDPAFRIVHRDALSNTLVPTIVIAVMWSQVDHGVLIAWGLLMIVGIGIKYAIAAAYLRHDVPCADVNKWGRRLSLSVVYFAVLWSSSVFLFYVDGSVVHQVFLYTWILAMSIGAAFAGIYWLPFYYLYAPPLMAALAVRLAMEGTLAHIALAAMIFSGALALLSFAKLLNKTVRSEMRLRHQSSALAKALQEKTEEAQKATLAKSRFLATASHDLRQPLHALSLFIDVFKESKSDRERAAIYPRIDASLDALRKLFDALLDMSRLDAKVVEPEYSHFEMADLLRGLGEEFRSSAEGKGLQLRIHAGPGVIVSDCLLLERILRNLISNAIRYTEAGGVMVSARSRKEDFLLQVWDTGIGIPPQNQEQVFVEFQQLHNQQRDRAEGLGLGLAIVRRLCGLLGYPLELRSRVGRGTVFSIRVPRGSPALLADRVPAVERRWDLTGRRALVIDDEAEILGAMRTLLGKWGIDVVTADSLSEAIKAMNERNVRPDLVLSDLRLRDGSTGIEAIDTLRDLYGQELPGILITGETAPEQLVAAKESGYKILQKPVRPAQLRSMLQHHLSIVEKPGDVARI
jgi:signal transduction histidine kinase/ActR/RegA family two-component response regulator